MLQRMKRWLRAKFGGRYNESVAVAAPTGMAAVSIGGMTLHSVMGCGVNNSIFGFGNTHDIRIYFMCIHVRIHVVLLKCVCTTILYMSSNLDDLHTHSSGKMWKKETKAKLRSLSESK